LLGFISKWATLVRIGYELRRRAVRRWDGLVDAYLEEYVARGVCASKADNVRRELER
jgi:hypothetical protein